MPLVTTIDRKTYWTADIRINNNLLLSIFTTGRKGLKYIFLNIVNTDESPFSEMIMCSN